MVERSQAVLRKEQLRADLFRSRPTSHAEWIVVTYTERCNRDIEGPGFGTEFLLREGFDVLAVRNAKDDWYVHLGAHELRTLNEALDPYHHRASYGSSMGAFAAVKFAKALKMKRVVAISPVLDLQYEWDTRYAVDIPLIQRAGDRAGGMITQADISPETTYHVAVDPLCKEDVRHALSLGQMAARHSLLKVRLGGHPVGPLMRDAAILGPYLKQAILSDDIEGIAFKPVRNARFMHNLGRYLLERNKLRSAAIANARALVLAADWGEVHLLQAQISHRLGCAQEVVRYGIEAIRLEPHNPYVVVIIAIMLIENNNDELAGKLVEAALGRMGPEEVLVDLKKRLGLKE